MWRSGVLALVAASLTAGVAGAQEQGPDWVRKPTGEDLRAAWPTAALSRGVSGKVVLACQVNLQGGLEDCEVESETPASYGFGAAALLMVPSFQMKPEMKDGKPRVSSVSIPISFLNPGGQGSSGAGGPAPNSRLGSSGDTAVMVVSPVWKASPSFADMAAAWPKGATGITSARVSMRCRVTPEGRLSQCNVLTETPGKRGFGAAARKLAPLFQLSSDPVGGAGRKDVYVNVAVSFVDPATPGARTIAHPTWIREPDEAQLAIFPQAAADKGLTRGVGVADCAIASDGSLTDCKVGREDPVGLGFGEAAVRVAQAMQMNPWTDDGRPVDGARIRLPIQFNKPTGEGK